MTLQGWALIALFVAVLGVLRMRVGTTLPLEEAIRAHEMIEGRVDHAPGKIVLVVG